MLPPFEGVTIRVNRYSVFHSIVYEAPAVAVNVRGLLVGPSDHLENDDRTSPDVCVPLKLTEQFAPGLHARVMGVVYVPAAQPVPVMTNCTATALVNVDRRL